MRIGVFGGAFNPVHNGHVKLASSYIESLNLDKLIVIPTANPPHKSSKDLIDGKDRLFMLNLAFKDVEKVEISDIEFNRQGKSYTYDTLLELKNIYKDADFYLIIGADQFMSFNKWYKYDEILKEVTLCTAAREENMRDSLKDFSKKLLKDNHCYIADFDPIVVSSSEIRENLKNNIDISFLIPKNVYNYIIEKGLYGV